MNMVDQGHDEIAKKGIFRARRITMRSLSYWNANEPYQFSYVGIFISSDVIKEGVRVWRPPHFCKNLFVCRNLEEILTQSSE